MIKKVLFCSLLLNLSLVAVGTFFVAKRLRFEQQAAAAAKAEPYLQNWQYVEQVNLEEAYNRPVNIVMFGDSHTFKMQWNELLNRFDIGNRGISTDITEGYLHRVNHVFDVSPRICFIEGGTNDICSNIPIDTIIGHLAILIDTMRAMRVVPVLTTLFPFAASGPNNSRYRPAVESLNKKIAALALAKGIDCIDLYSILTKDGYLDPHYAQADGVHLSALGYLKWKPEIEKILIKYHL